MNVKISAAQGSTHCLCASDRRASRCVRIPHSPQDQQTSNTPQTGALVIGTTSTDGANSLSMSHNVRFHRVLRYRRQWTSPITPTDPNLPKRLNKRAVKLTTGFSFFAYTESLLSRGFPWFGRFISGESGSPHAHQSFNTSGDGCQSIRFGWRGREQMKET